MDSSRGEPRCGYPCGGVPPPAAVPSVPCAVAGSYWPGLACWKPGEEQLVEVDASVQVLRMGMEVDENVTIQMKRV